MKILLGIFLIIIRIIVSVKIISWMIQEYNYSDLHSISEVEFYLVFLIFDIWISISNSGIEIPNKE
jgi:vancomycin permeability regulator SanA